MLCPVRICKHDGKQKYLYKRRRRAGSVPHPLPRSDDGAVGGRGGGGWQVMSCLGILSGEGGISGMRIWRVMFACEFGVFPWQDILAGLLGGSIWRVKLAHLFSGFFKARKDICCRAMKRNRKE